MAANGEEDGDSRQLQLSDLPDEILMHILSLLPTTESAVWTCLLVLRRSGQQDLWKSLTRLGFRGVRWFLKRNDHLLNFVEKVMDLRDHSVPLESFFLECNMKRDHDSDRIQKWITKAAQSNVEHLTLYNFDNYYYHYDDSHDDYVYCTTRILPFCILECQSVVKLDLESIKFRIPSSVICFPRLKYLRLEGVELDGYEYTMKLLSSPLLEELIISQCYHWGSIHVCCPKLQVLKIWDRDLYHRAEICIVADSLKYFSYNGNLYNGFRICATSSTQLTEVEIYVDQQMFRDLNHGCPLLLKGLSGTRNLALSYYFLEGLQNISEPLDIIPVFECVTRLIIRVYEKICIDSLELMEVYERCPQLEYLNIGNLSHTVRSPQLSPVPLCFRRHLKKILVNYYVPGDNESDAAIDVLLNSAFVLEELIIYCKRDVKNGFHEGGRKIQELRDRLNRRPRVSKDCIISVIGHCIDLSRHHL